MPVGYCTLLGLDSNIVVRYTELVSAIENEPNYEAARRH